MFSRARSVTSVEGTELLLSILLEVATCCVSMLFSLDSPGTFSSKTLFETGLKNALIADGRCYYQIRNIKI